MAHQSHYSGNYGQPGPGRNSDSAQTKGPYQRRPTTNYNSFAPAPSSSYNMPDRGYQPQENTFQQHGTYNNPQQQYYSTAQQSTEHKSQQYAQRDDQKQPQQGGYPWGDSGAARSVHPPHFQKRSWESSYEQQDRFKQRQEEPYSKKFKPQSNHNTSTNYVNQTNQKQTYGVNVRQEMGYPKNDESITYRKYQDTLGGNQMPIAGGSNQQSYGAQVSQLQHGTSGQGNQMLIAGGSNRQSYGAQVSQLQHGTPGQVIRMPIGGGSNQQHYGPPVSQPPQATPQVIRMPIGGGSNQQHYGPPVSQPPQATPQVIRMPIGGGSNQQHYGPPVSQPPQAKPPQGNQMPIAGGNNQQRYAPPVSQPPRGNKKGKKNKSNKNRSKYKYPALKAVKPPKPQAGNKKKTNTQVQVVDPMKIPNHPQGDKSIKTQEKRQHKQDLVALQTYPVIASIEKAMNEEVEAMCALIEAEVKRAQKVQGCDDDDKREECVEHCRRFLCHNISKRITNNGLKIARVYGEPKPPRRDDLEAFLRGRGCVSLKKSVKSPFYAATFNTYENLDRLCADRAFIGDNVVYFKHMHTAPKLLKFDHKKARNIYDKYIASLIKSSRVDLLSRDWPIQEEEEKRALEIKAADENDIKCVDQKAVGDAGPTEDFQLKEEETNTESMEAKVIPVGANEGAPEDSKMNDGDWNEKETDWVSGNDEEIEPDEQCGEFGDADVDDVDEDDLEDY